MIVLHLGNGASASAVRAGRCVDTSMGLTPLEGLVMGTRSGDMDPAVIFHLMRVGEMSADEIDTLLNKKSGLIGLCGDNDMREIRRRVDAGTSRRSWPSTSTFTVSRSTSAPITPFSDAWTR
ncbi:Acetate kinase [Streptomyces tendae]